MGDGDPGLSGRVPRDGAGGEAVAPAGGEQGSGSDRVDGLLRAMTLPEKVSLLAGSDVWRLPAIDRLGIPSLVMSDGPAGVRGSSFLSGRSVSFPCGTALGATWDPELVRQVGRALGHEARRTGVHVLLGPTVNLHRHPLAGRNFECFSEDPELTAVLSTAYVEGVQAMGVACCIKHLVCNDSEFERHTISAEVTEDTLREIYLLPFERAVEAGVWSLMASYNRLNGTYTSEHPWLLGDLLRDEWGFDGVVVSDWFATHTTVDALVAGLDVEMPGLPAFRGEALVAAVEAGEVDEEVVDRAVGRVLRLICRTAGFGAVPASGVVSDGITSNDGIAGSAGIWGTTNPSGRPRANERVRPSEPARPELAERAVAETLVRRVGARAMVLLKNEGAVLPLEPAKLGSVAVVGPSADVGAFQGGGSARVSPLHVAGILPLLTEALGPQVQVGFERGCITPEWPQALTAPFVSTPAGEPGVLVESYLCSEPTGPPLSAEVAAQLQVSFIGRYVDGRDNDEIVLRTRALLHPAQSGRFHLSVAGTGNVRVSLDGEALLEQSWRTAGRMVFALGEQSARVPVELRSGEERALQVDFEPAADSRLSLLEVAVVPPNPPDLLERAVALARRSDTVVVVADSPPGWESEGRDRRTMALPGNQDALISAVAAANPRTVVVLNAGAPVTMPWVDDVAAVVAMWFPGQELGRSLADVLTGAVNPCGRLPTTFPRTEQDVASHANYPGSDGVVTYAERGNFGYRRPPGTTGPQPLFAFGHGLSYSTVELGLPELSCTGAGESASYVVAVPVVHRGGPAAREVVQVYVATDRPDGPDRQLQGFCAVEVAPGSTAVAEVRIERGRLRRWAGSEWRVPAGPLHAWVGTSAADLPYELELPDIALPGSDPVDRER